MSLCVLLCMKDQGDDNVYDVDGRRRSFDSCATVKWSGVSRAQNETTAIHCEMLKFRVLLTELLV